MSVSEEPSPSHPTEPPPKVDEQRLALRRITQRLKQLRAELDRVNQQQAGGDRV